MRLASHGTAYVVEQSGSMIRFAREATNGLPRRSPSGRVRRRARPPRARLPPGYARNRLFYIAYTSKQRPEHRGALPLEGCKAVPSSRKILLAVPDPYGNHNGGHLAFGPDGRLYTSTGTAAPEVIPRTGLRTCSRSSGSSSRSTSRGPSARWTIAALGLRNPWRFSFDRATRRPLHRRRRSERGRGGQLRSAPEPRPRELRLGSLRGLAAVRGREVRARQARVTGLRVQPRPGLQRHRWIRVPRIGARLRSGGGTSSATTAAGRSGASASPTAARPT